MCCLAICASLSKPPPSMPIMINQGSLFMLRNLLILGGTTEASSLAYLISKTEFNATISYAGRVGRVRQQPIQKRIGGFGGVDGLSSYIISKGITHLVDATHPFATQISHNAILACQKTGIPLAALTRPKWKKQEGDKWCLVPDIDAASEFHKFWHVAMSLSKPILAVIALGAFNGAYSNFMFAVVLCPDEKMWTLMVWLVQMQAFSSRGAMMASLVLSAIPTLVVFIFAQNIILRGIVLPVEK